MQISTLTRFRDVICPCILADVSGSRIVKCQWAPQVFVVFLWQTNTPKDQKNVWSLLVPSPSTWQANRKGVFDLCFLESWLVLKTCALLLVHLYNGEERKWQEIVLRLSLFEITSCYWPYLYITISFPRWKFDDHPTQQIENLIEIKKCTIKSKL